MHDDGKTTIIDGNGKAKSLVTITAVVLSYVRGQKKWRKAFTLKKLVARHNHRLYLGLLDDF